MRLLFLLICQKRSIREGQYVKVSHWGKYLSIASREYYVYDICSYVLFIEKVYQIRKHIKCHRSGTEKQKRVNDSPNNRAISLMVGNRISARFLQVLKELY
ncbi:hypothetical protein Bca4012_038966 [Brassica carinata]